MHLLCGDFNFHSGILPNYITPTEGLHDNEVCENVLVYEPDVFISFCRYEIDCARFSQNMSHGISTITSNIRTTMYAYPIAE